MVGRETHADSFLPFFLSQTVCSVTILRDLADYVNRLSSFVNKDAPVKVNIMSKEHITEIIEV